MPDFDTICEVGLHKGKAGRRHVFQPPHTGLDQGAGKMGFASPYRAMQQQRIACLQKACQGCAKAGSGGIIRQKQ